MVALQSQYILLLSLFQVRLSPMTDLVVAASVPPYQLYRSHTAQMFVNLRGPQTPQVQSHLSYLFVAPMLPVLLDILSADGGSRVCSFSGQSERGNTFVPTAFFSRLSDVFGPSTHHIVHYSEG
jgi:hypothetical protein